DSSHSRASVLSFSNSSSRSLNPHVLNFLWSSIFDLGKSHLRFHTKADAPDLPGSSFQLSSNSFAYETKFDSSANPIPQAQNSKIVFTSNRDGCMQIYLMNTDGSNQVR